MDAFTSLIPKPHCDGSMKPHAASWRLRPQTPPTEDDPWHDPWVHSCTEHLAAVAYDLVDGVIATCRLELEHL